MPELLRMPEVSADADSATLADWPLAEQTPYTAGVVIAAIETAKALVDIEAESDGVIVKYLVEPGAVVRVGDPIALTAQPGESVPDATQALISLGVSSGPMPAMPDVPRPAAPDLAAGLSATHRTFSSPLARRLAREANLSIESISGTGPAGRILRRDVEDAVARQSEPVADLRPAERPTASPPVNTVGQTQIPHSRIRRMIAQRLTESTQTTPHFYLRGTAEVDQLLSLRAELKGEGLKVSVNDLVVKAVACAHRSVPGVNVIWGPDAVTQFTAVDLAIAVATPTGLVTPVVRGVDRMPISELAATTQELAERAQRGQLKQAELEGGSATVTNLGMFGTSEFAAIINPPQSTILAVGAITLEPAVNEDRSLRVASQLRLTLSVDHRPIDGATAAQWMKSLLEILEHPVRILA